MAQLTPEERRELARKAEGYGQRLRPPTRKLSLKAPIAGTVLSVCQSFFVRTVPYRIMEQGGPIGTTR